MYDLIVKCEQMTAALPEISQRLAAIHALHEQGNIIFLFTKLIHNSFHFIIS